MTLTANVVLAALQQKVGLSANQLYGLCEELNVTPNTLQAFLTSVACPTPKTELSRATKEDYSTYTRAWVRAHQLTDAQTNELYHPLLRAICRSYQDDTPFSGELLEVSRTVYYTLHRQLAGVSPDARINAPPVTEQQLKQFLAVQDYLPLPGAYFLSYKRFSWLLELAKSGDTKHRSYEYAQCIFFRSARAVADTAKLNVFRNRLAEQRASEKCVQRS